ncbi:hypothetical protein H9Q13_06180 [Pontibacter sp. JH31]|uniref:Helix-turn-helix domain-containing protein n=1 Tax=Pontibacter aquaedesilientis TaxID=2766980 RepID=A0ABR7XGK3_9BACT|nr:helix-turn-helix domain-containing protein [Pontibacter aquaedesilientis]MBD1396748.1 hypothetical protein [Pontibacter aquaedesilientis]
MNERGYIISKSKFYKLTASESIPHKRFGNRLVFSHAELLKWVELQTVQKNTCREATLQLSKSANRKKGGRNG